MVIFWKNWFRLDSTAVLIFVVILVELTNTVFVNSTSNVSTNIERAVQSICKVKPGPRKKTKTAADTKIAHVQMLLKMNRRSSKSRGGDILIDLGGESIPRPPIAQHTCGPLSEYETPFNTIGLTHTHLSMADHQI